MIPPPLWAPAPKLACPEEAFVKHPAGNSLAPLGWVCSLSLCPSPALTSMYSPTPQQVAVGSGRQDVCSAFSSRLNTPSSGCCVCPSPSLLWWPVPAQQYLSCTSKTMMLQMPSLRCCVEGNNCSSSAAAPAGLVWDDAVRIRQLTIDCLCKTAQRSCPYKSLFGYQAR